MALIQCPDCGREVSDQAAACIGCGHPVNPQPPQVQTIQATSKYYKGLQAVGVVGVVFGFFLWMTAGLHLETGVVLALGSALYLAGRWGRWWYHG